MNGITNFFPNQLFRTVRIWNIFVNQWSRAHLLVNSVPLLLRFQRFSKRIPDTSRLSSQNFSHWLWKKIESEMMSWKWWCKCWNALQKWQMQQINKISIIWELSIRTKLCDWEWKSNASAEIGLLIEKWTNRYLQDWEIFTLFISNKYNGRIQSDKELQTLLN